MTAQSGQYYEESFICSSSATLAGSQYCIVSLSTATQSGGRASIALCSGSSIGVNGPVGILQDAPAVGRAGAVRMLGLGTSKVVATSTGATTLGGPATCNASGQAVNAGTTGEIVIGKFIVATTGVSGNIAEVLLNGPFIFAVST
jgi:hypothetical protein